MPMIMDKAKSAAEAKFEEYVNNDGDGFADKVKEEWAKAKPDFLAEDKNTHGVFSFGWLAKEHAALNELCVKEVLATMDDFKDEMCHVNVHKFFADKPEKCRFEVAIIYGNLRDTMYMEMVDEHKAKKRRTEEEPAKQEPPALRREQSVCA